MNKTRAKHYTAIISFSAEPDALREIVSNVNECVQKHATSSAEITIIEQDDND